MGWTAPRDWVAGEVVTASIMNTHVRDQLRYLKGLDGVPTIQSGLTIDNSLGSERLLLPLLSTAECTTVLNAEGEIAHDEDTNRIKMYDGTAIRSIVTTADVDDTPVDGAATDPVSSNWAFDHVAAADPHTGYVLESLADAQGDIFYATADNTWTRLAKGTGLQFLQMNAGATAPQWANSVSTKEFFVPCGVTSGGVPTSYGNNSVVILNSGTDSVYFSFRIPADFITFTSVKVLIVPTTTGTFDWSVTTNFGADGESYTIHTDSATADGQAATNDQLLELDISTAYTGIAVNDIVGTKFVLDVLTTTTQVSVIGLNVKYG